MIAEVPEPRNAVVLHYLDIDEELKRSGLDGPVVVSRPPKMVRVGETLSYQIQTISKSGKPVYKLDAAPEGMVLSESGLLQWTPGTRPASGTASAVISITDSGQTKFHTVVLAVQAPEGVRVAAENVSAEKRPAAGARQQPLRSRPRNRRVSVDKRPAAGTSPVGRAAGDIYLKLPATYEDVCAGGGGRFLVFSLTSLQKLAVVDVFAAKIIGYVPVADNCLFAAGADKLVVIYPEKFVIQRFDLETRKLETTQPLPAETPATLVAMGCASHGPVLVGVGDRRVGAQALLLELDTLKPLVCKMPQQYSVELDAGSRVRASADGRVFAAWRTSGSPSGLELLVFDGRELAQFYEHTTAGWVAPNETGDRIYTVRGIYTNQLRRSDSSASNLLNRGGAIPAVHGPFFLRMSYDEDASRKGPESGASADLYLTDETQPIATLRNLPLRASNYYTQFARDRVTPDKRVYLVPSGRVVALLPETQDSVVLRRFDLEEELRRSGKDYLVVLSSPPRSVAVGQVLQYQLVVKSKSGKARYQLESGPEGMTVSDSGLVRWDVKARPAEGAAQVIISVAGGANETALHCFTVAVKARGDMSPVAGSGVASLAKPSPSTAAEENAAAAKLAPEAAPPPAATRREARWQVRALRKSPANCRGRSTACAWAPAESC